jgi:hypothetical protein
MIRIALITIVSVSFFLEGCFVPVPYPPNGQNQQSPASARSRVREVVDPADIPALFKGCTGHHRVDGRRNETERGVSFDVNEYNRRECPPVQLN